jgi:hypothetical protein
MQYKALSLVALAAGVSAQAIIPTDSVGASVINVLATAIPPESISLAVNNPASFSALLASSLAAGKTPAWYVALPSDVKSYLPLLYPASTTAEATLSPTPSASASEIETPSITPTPSGRPSFTGTVGTGSTTLGNSTIGSVSSATLGSTGGANSEVPTGSAVSTGGASYPTAVFGAGVAGALGFLGMLAL